MSSPGAPTWWRRDGDAIVLSLHVQPGASRSTVVGPVENELRIRIAARAVDGAANEALLAFLADRLGVRRRDLTLLRGDRARHKSVQVADATGTLDPGTLVAND